jgi:hypothetical protein
LIEQCLVIKEFILKICKRERIVSCFQSIGGDKGIECRIEPADDVRNQVFIISRPSYHSKLVGPSLGNFEVLGTGFGSLVKALELTLQMRDSRPGLGSKTTSQCCPNLLRGVKAIDTGKDYLSESHIDPAKEALVLFDPNRIQWIKDLFAFCICQELRWAGFRTIHNAHQLMAFQYRNNLR